MNALLERVLPHYDKREYHERVISAAPEAVWLALTELRVNDLTMTMALMRIRGGPVAWLRGGAAPPDMRAVEAFPPRSLIEDAPRELVLGDIARYASLNPIRPAVARGDLAAFEAFAEPGWTKVAMNFRLTPLDGATLLSTETRIQSTDARTRRRFRLYWMLVRAGSGLIRRDLLGAIADWVDNGGTR